MQSSAIITLLLLVLPCVCGCTDPSDTRSGDRQLFYIGLALFPEQWSENDVVDLGNLLQKNHPGHVVELIASNSASEPRRFPVADDRAIAALVRSAAEHAGPDDIVFVHISTHGSSHWLASQFGRGPPRMITGAQLASQFAPLDRQAKVIIIISACYSGSLIPSLQAPRRIIITAARADRNSFGCSPSRRHTYFGEAELHAFAESGHSLQQIVEDLRDTVASMEHQKRLTSSEPQVSVGSNVGNLYVTRPF